MKQVNEVELDLYKYSLLSKRAISSSKSLSLSNKIEMLPKSSKETKEL